MKKYFLLAFVVAVAAASSARAQSFSAPVDGNRPQQKEHPVPPPSTGKAVGAFPRVFARGGNPLQLINPRAPRRYYGRVDDTVVVGDRAVPPKNRGEDINRFPGVVLFGIAW